MTHRAILLLLVLPFATACGSGGTNDASGGLVTGDPFVDLPGEPPPLPPPPPPPPPAPTPPGSTTTSPFVTRTSTPPIGLTWKVGYTENATAAQLKTVYSQVLAMNSALWNVTEGQVYIYEVVITDDVGAGTTPTGWLANYASINTSDLDILVWPPSQWDLAGAAGLTLLSNQIGRSGAMILLPSNESTHTWLHEAGHFIWDLSWAVSFGLEDEYIDGVQDVACNMESTNSPQRWCSDTNHAFQGAQPHSCWKQILTDYTKFKHEDKDTASSAPWKTKVTYNDVP